MEIMTNYSIGDKVKVRTNRVSLEKCPFCNGEAKKIVAGKELYCQNCDDGFITVTSNSPVYKEGIVTEIKVNVEELDSSEGNYSYVDDGKGILIEYRVEIEDKEYDSQNSINEKKLDEWNR